MIHGRKFLGMKPFNMLRINSRKFKTNMGPIPLAALHQQEQPMKKPILFKNSSEPHLGGDGKLPNQAGFVVLYPATSLSVAPNYMEIAINLPDGVGKTVDRRMYLLPKAAVTAENAAKHEKIFGFHGDVAPEDNRISEALT